MNNDVFNLKLSYDLTLRILDMENVFIIPVCYVSESPNPDEIVYVENDSVHVCHKDDIFESVEIANEVLIPLSLYITSRMATPYPDEVSQKLYFHQSLNQLTAWLSNNKLKGDITVVPSYINQHYDSKKMAAVYFVSEPGDMSRDKIKQINEHFLRQHDLPLSNMSAIGTHIYLYVQDKINMYDIAKHLNYIKLKGFTDNVIYIDLEIRKKTFDVFDVRKEIAMFMKHFFGE